MTITGLIRKFCCCEGEFSDNEELLDNEEEGETNILPSRGGPSRESMTNMYISGSATDSIQGTPVTRNTQADNEEEKRLNEIIDATRQNVVLIGNTNEYAPNNEELARAKQYEEKVKQHDNRLRKLHAPTPADVDSSALKDVGERVLEVLSAEPVPLEKINFAKNAAKKLFEAIDEGMEIKNKQDIIVHMPLEEDVISSE